jgi:hypothetical protein
MAAKQTSGTVYIVQYAWQPSCFTFEQLNVVVFFICRAATLQRNLSMSSSINNICWVNIKGKEEGALSNFKKGYFNVLKFPNYNLTNYTETF